MLKGSQVGKDALIAHKMALLSHHCPARRGSSKSFSKLCLTPLQLVASQTTSSFWGL